MPSGLTVGFVDTNILIYAFADSAEPDPRRGTAGDLVAKLVSENRICLSTQVLQEFAANALRKSTSPDAHFPLMQTMAALSQWPVFQVDPRAIQEAVTVRGRHRLSIWDALIIVSAKRMGATVLYTEDLNHGQMIEGVRVVNPFVAAKAE